MVDHPEGKTKALRTASFRKICHHGLHSTKWVVAKANMDVGALAEGISLRCLDFDAHTRRGGRSIHCNIQDSQLNQRREAGQAGHS